MVVIALLVALAALALLWAGWRLRRACLAFRLGRARRRGARGEARAARLLAQHGWAVVAVQERAVGRLLVDGVPLEFELCADVIVERCGRRLVAEVKTGAAASPRNRATRRQLLEYAWAFGLDGVLLVDMASEQIVEIEFPGIEKTFDRSTVGKRPSRRETP